MEDRGQINGVAAEETSWSAGLLEKEEEEGRGASAGGEKEAGNGEGKGEKYKPRKLSSDKYRYEFLCLNS